MVSSLRLFPPFRPFAAPAGTPESGTPAPPAAVSPPLARADRRRLVEQPVFFLLPGQPGEFGQERVPGRKERFLAVENGGIGARR